MRVSAFGHGLALIARMVLSLTPTLEAAIASSQRRPAVTVTTAATRAGVDLLRWERIYTAVESDCPHAAVAIPDSGTLVRARNDGGNIDVSRVTFAGPGSTFTSWTTLVHSIPVASCVALAAIASTEIILLTTDAVGTALRIKTSTDDGATWSASSTLVTEGSAIEHIALVMKPNGDCCAFYTLAGSTTLKRLRRTSGTWAGSGTNWTRSGSVATLTGIAATYDGADFALLVSGTEVTTLHPRTWSVRMGDTVLPANAWSSLNSVAEADALSTTTFASPSIALIGLTVQGSWSHIESGDVAYARAFTSHPPLGLGAGSVWTEGAPHEAEGDHGLAIAADNTNAQVFACRPGGVWWCRLGIGSTFTTQVLSVDYTIGTDSSKCRVELDDRGRELLDSGDVAGAGLSPGCDLEITPGYFTAAGSVEAAAVQSFIIDRVSVTAAGGRRVVTVDASAGWEQLDRWRAPAAWQVAAGSLTRAQIFQRIAGRAGCLFQDGSSPNGPSSDWTTYTPAFAVAAGESAASVLRRLLAVAVDYVRANGAVLEIVSTTTSDTLAASFAPPGPGAAAPLASSLTLVIDDGDAPNWLRVQGPDRYADAHDFDAIYAHGASHRAIRNLDATTDGKATSWSVNALRRVTVEQPFGQLVAPFHPGLQLLDLVEAAGGDYQGHIVALGMKYSRGPKAARFDSVLTLGGN